MKLDHVALTGVPLDPNHPLWKQALSVLIDQLKARGYSESSTIRLETHTIGPSFDEFAMPGRPAMVLPGKTLRDEFAMASITGCLPGSYVDADKRAQWAYRMADAMMKARDR